MLIQVLAWLWCQYSGTNWSRLMSHAESIISLLILKSDLAKEGLRGVTTILKEKVTHYKPTCQSNVRERRDSSTSSSTPRGRGHHGDGRVQGKEGGGASQQ